MDFFYRCVHVVRERSLYYWMRRLFTGHNTTQNIGLKYVHDGLYHTVHILFETGHDMLAMS
jgi:hypothetical protein